MQGSIERARMLAQEVGRAGSPDAFADVVVDRLWDLIPSDDVTFNDIDEKARRIVVARSRSILPGDDIDDEVWANYDDLPFCKGFGPGESGIARMSDVLDRAALDRSPIYRDVMWPDGYRYSVEVVFASPPTLRRAVLLGRADRDFTVRECDLLALLLPHLEDAYRRARLTSLLTPREREVLSLVGEGLTNREIARRLEISPGTVRAHLEHAFPKLGVGSRTAAISIVRQSGSFSVSVVHVVLEDLEARHPRALDALGPAPRAELLHVLTPPADERAGRIGEFSLNSKTRT